MRPKENVNKYKQTLIELPARVPRLTIVVIVTLLLNSAALLVILLIVRQLVGQKSTADDWTIDFVRASEEFSPGQAVTITGDTVTVYVPPFAIPLPGSILMIAREPDLNPTANQPEWSRPQVVDVQFQNTEGTPVHNLVLSAPIRLCFKLTQTQWQDFAGRPGFIAVQYYALKQNTPTWLNLPMAKYPDRLQICAWTDHLSLFALAIRSEPAIPVTEPTTTADPTATATQRSSMALYAETAVAQRNLDAHPTSTPIPTYTLRPLPTSTAQFTASPTNPPLPTATKYLTGTPTNTPRPTATATRRPTATPTRTPLRTSTPWPTAASSLASATPLPSATHKPPTATVLAPTNTPHPTFTRRPTATRPPPTATSAPPPATNTPQPPPTNPPPPTSTDPPPPTDIPPTNPPPPTDIPPTNPPPPTTYP